VHGGWVTPHGAQNLSEQRIALLVAALVDVPDGTDHECGVVHGVEAIWFHAQPETLARPNPSAVTDTTEAG